MFVVEMTTREGKVSETYETYEEAVRRVEQFPAEGLLGTPLIFHQLPDASERLVREDGKPLQFHRRLDEHELPAPEEPLPLSDEPSGLVDGDGKLRLVDPHAPADDWDDLPLV